MKNTTLSTSTTLLATFFQFRCYDGMHYTVVDKYSRLNFIAISSFDLIIAVPALLLNVTFLYVAFKHPKFRRSTSNLLLINLAFIDALLAALVIPLHGVQMIMHAQSKSACWLTKLNDLTSVILSTPAFINLIFITFDTYCGIVFPFFYTEQVTPTKLLTGMWLSCIVFIIATATCNIIPSLWNVFTLGYSIIDSLAIIFFIFCYTHIYLTVSRIHRRVSCVSVSKTTASTARRRRRSSSNGASKEKTFFISFFIVLFFVLSFLPSGIYYLFKITGKETRTIRTYLFPWTYSLRLSSALVNSFIYYWRLLNIRKATVELLPDCLKTSKMVRSSPSANEKKTSLKKTTRHKTRSYSAILPKEINNQKVIKSNNQIAQSAETSLAESEHFNTMTSQIVYEAAKRSGTEFESPHFSPTFVWDKKEYDTSSGDALSDSTTIRSLSRKSS